MSVSMFVFACNALLIQLSVGNLLKMSLSSVISLFGYLFCCNEQFISC